VTGGWLSGCLADSHPRCLPTLQKKHLRELFSVSLSWIGQSPPLREYVARVVGNSHAPYEVDGVSAVKDELNNTKTKLDEVRWIYVWTHEVCGWVF